MSFMGGSDSSSSDRQTGPERFGLYEQRFQAFKNAYSTESYMLTILLTKMRSVTSSLKPLSVYGVNGYGKNKKVFSVENTVTS